MPETVETTVYRLSELDEVAKEKARDWYRGLDVHDDWYEFGFEDFQQVCEILGVSFATSSVPLMGGGTRQKPRIYFRGFWSQGDGASYEGYYCYAKATPRRIRDYAPKDAELHRIADALQAIQRRNFYQLHASAHRRGHHCHEYCMEIAVVRESQNWQDMTEDAEVEVAEAIRDLARWLYRQLEAEYEYQTSDPVVDETIEANDYTFTETGRRFD